MLLYDRMVFMQIGVNKVKHIIYGFVDNGISYGRSKKKMAVCSLFRLKFTDKKGILHGLQRWIPCGVIILLWGELSLQKQAPVIRASILYCSTNFL